MENERPAGEDKSSESKKLSFLEAWQQRLGILPELPKEDSEKEPAETKKGKRWQNLFGRVFGGIVKPTPIESKVETAKDTLFIQHALPQEESMSKPDDTLYVTHEPMNSSEIIEPLQSSISEVKSEIPKFEALPATPTESKSEVNSITETLKPPTAPPDIITALNNQTLEVPVYEPAEAAPSNHTISERVIERNGRGIGVAAGLFGLEFLARRRADRKLKKEIKRLDQSRKYEYQHRPLRTIETHPNRTEPITNRTSTPEMKMPAPETVKIRSAEAHLPQKAEKKLQRKIELSRDVTSEARVKLEKPEKVLEKVAKAAEKNVPIEKIFERSHEIKDEPSQYLGAAPIGAILSRSDTENQSAFTAATKKIIEAQQKAMSASSHSTQPDLYKQAVKSGFWTAVVLIVCIGVFITFNS